MYCIWIIQNPWQKKWKGKQTIEVVRKCLISGEYAHEKKICDKILRVYVPTTTYNNDGQPSRRNKQITRECSTTCFTYMYILRHLRTVPYGRERARRYNLRKWNSRRIPFINNHTVPYKKILPRSRTRGKRHERRFGLWDLLRICISEIEPTHERWRVCRTCVLRHIQKVTPRLSSTMYPTPP